MDLSSPEFSQIHLSEIVPTHLDSFKIANSKPLYGTTVKGEYLFQNFYCKNIEASFLNLFSSGKHEIVLLKPITSFIVTVQLINTLNLKVYNLPPQEHLEWSINLFYTNNVNAEISLSNEKEYSAFFLFIPPGVLQRLSRGYPLIQRFYKSQSNKDVTDKLFSSNAICNFKVMDLVKSFQFGKPKTLKPYVELIHACFDLFSSKNVLKQTKRENGTTRKIYALKKFMFEHPTEKFKRETLCAKFDLSIYYFEKSFSNIYGAPPFSFMRFCAMSEVKQELQNSNAGLKEIAAKHGYTYTSLLRTYRSVYKEHPKYRRNKMY